jgi:hypothetical protein
MLRLAWKQVWVSVFRVLVALGRGCECNICPCNHVGSTQYTEYTQCTQTVEGSARMVRTPARNSSAMLRPIKPHLGALIAIQLVPRQPNTGSWLEEDLGHSARGT